MSYHNSPYPFRRPRSNTQEPHRVRRHRNRVHGQHITIDNEQPLDRNTIGDQPSGWWGAFPDGESTVMSYPDTSIPDTYDFSGQNVWSGSAVQDTSGNQGAIDSNYSSTRLATGEPAWEDLPIAYQPHPHGHAEALVSPTASPMDGVVIPEAPYSPDGPAGPTAWSGYQVGQAGESWADPAHRDWEIETDVDLGQPSRRWSTRARQGSDAAFSGAPILMNASDTIEEHESSGGSSETTPVDRTHLVDGFVDDENAPWSPEFPRRHHHESYSYRQ